MKNEFIRYDVESTDDNLKLFEIVYFSTIKTWSVFHSMFFDERKRKNAEEMSELSEINKKLKKR